MMNLDISGSSALLKALLHVFSLFPGTRMGRQGLRWKLGGLGSEVRLQVDTAPR